MLGVSIVGLIVLLIGTYFVSYVALRHTTDKAESQNEYLDRMTRANADLLTALVNQEVGLRGYLATGEQAFLDPYHRGIEQQHEAWGEMLAPAVEVNDEVRSAIAALDAAIDAWRQKHVELQLEARRKGPLPDIIAAFHDGKELFDEVRTKQSAVTAALDAREAALNEAVESRVEMINVLVVALAALVLVLALVATRYLLEHTVRPLTELARKAEDGSQFAEPPADTRIHEVFALASSLHRLDESVRAREDALEEAHRDAVALGEFGEFVQQLSEESELYRSFDRVAKDLIAPSRLNIMVRNASKNRLELAHPETSVEEQLKHPILSEPMKCRAVRTLREVGADSDAPTACYCALGVPAQGSYMCVPMLAAGELVGVVNCQSQERDYFDDKRAGALQGYVGFAGATISSMRLITATRERALRDGLTGVYNRAFLAEYMTKAIAIAKRRSAPLSVLMLDLDHFKRINDEHGHLAGDHAIIALARCLQHATRSTDAVVRYGGEEFVVLLIDAALDAAQATAERIRVLVENTPVNVANIELGRILRASIGVAAFPTHGTDERSLLAAADAALYRAKHEGRNRVKIATDIPATAA